MNFLSIPEVCLILRQLKERRMNKNQRFYTVPFEATLEYTDRFSLNKNKTKTTSMRELLRNYQRLTEYEFTALWNLMPSKPDEARALIKSLERFEDEDDYLYLENALKEIENFKALTYQDDYDMKD